MSVANDALKTHKLDREIADGDCRRRARQLSDEGCPCARETF